MKNIDYQNSVVSVTSSLLKYYNIDANHNSLECLDEILKEKKPKNVVLFLCDGLGSFNLNYHLDKYSFLRKNKIKNIKTVFPPTTTAATTSVLTGLYPSEHNWYGWHMYFKDTNETIALYQNRLKENDSIPKLGVLDRDYMKYKTIVDLINEKNVDKAYYAYPFVSENPCRDIYEVVARIEKICNNETDNRNFIYAYIENPDKTMHEFGIFSNEVKSQVELINKEIEGLSSKIHDTLIIVIADHGLVTNKKTIILEKDIKEMYDMLERTTAIEARASGIKLKNGVLKEDFLRLFDKYLSKDFVLFSKDEVISNEMFGSIYNEYLLDTIGDYLIVAIADKSLEYSNDYPLFLASHAGLRKEELTVPLIVIDCL